MDPELDDAPELTEYYDIFDAGDELHLFCLKCGKGFALKKTGLSVGNRSALLDHARSHHTLPRKGFDRA